MIYELLQYLRNWFVYSKHYGEFKIENGNIEANFDSGAEFSSLTILDGQYFRIIGSHLNDGVWKYPATDLADETFSGAVWVLSIPKAVVSIAEEIEQWQSKNGAAAASPWQSESYSRGAYSRSKGSASDAAVSWQNAFQGRLAPWRKI